MNYLCNKDFSITLGDCWRNIVANRNMKENNEIRATKLDGIAENILPQHFVNSSQRRNCIHSVPIVKVTLNRSFSLAVFPVYSDPQMFFKMFVIWVKLLLQRCNYVAPLCEFLCALTGNHKSWIVSNIFRKNKIICMYAISNAKHQSMFSHRSFQRSNFSPLWSLRMWADKFLLCTKSFPQTLQQYGLLPVWTLMWTIKL